VSLRGRTPALFVLVIPNLNPADFVITTLGLSFDIFANLSTFYKTPKPL
jgi:hypothetical protein